MKLYLLLSLFLSSLAGSSCAETPLSVPPSAVNEDHQKKHPWMEWIEKEEAPDAPFHETPEKESDSFHAKFLRMLAVLGLMIAFMILASWALKRMMKSRIHQLNVESSLKVLESRHLSPRSTVYIIEIDGQRFLIGESPSTLVLLAPLSAERSSIE